MLDEPNNLNDNEIPEGDNIDNEPTEEATPPEETSNRTFLIVAGILGFLILLTLAGVAAWIFYFGPKMAAPNKAAQQTRAAENAQAILQGTQTAEAALWTPTLPPTAIPTDTPIPTQAAPTNTPVVAINTATTSGGASAAESSTLVFLQTQLSVQLTGTASAAVAAAQTTPTGSLATTGFFDQVGLPGLIVLTLALLGVIFIARRMRVAPVR